MKLVVIAATIMASVLPSQCAADVSEKAVRLGNPVHIATEQPPNTVRFADVEMPWFDYSATRVAEYQIALDECKGAILYWQASRVRVFAAHNKTCPINRSFSKTLEVNEVYVDGVRHTLLKREQFQSGQTISVPTLSIDADVSTVGLQTTTAYPTVTISWFIRN